MIAWHVRILAVPALLLAVLAQGSCGEVPAAVAPVAVTPLQATWIDIEPILKPLMYRQMLARLCRISTDVNVRDEFVAEFKQMQPAPDLVQQVDLITHAYDTSDTPLLPRNICTAEMIASTKIDAAAAQTAWTKLKGRAS